MRYLYFSVVFFMVLSCSNNKSENNDGLKSTVQLLKARADSCYQIDQYEVAIEYFDQLILQDSTQGEFFYKRAYSKDQLLKYEEASDDYQKSIQLGYRPSDCYYNLGLSQILLLNDSLAVVLFEKSLEFDPNNAKARSALNACKNRMNESNI